MILAFITALCSVSVSVRIVAVSSQPLQPMDGGSPCSNVSLASCVGGYPAMAALLRAQAEPADGAVLIGSYLQVDRVVQGHPDGLNINDRLWARLGVSCVNLYAPYFLTWAKRVGAAQTIAEQQIPVVSSNLDLDQGKLFRGMFHYYHIAEPVDGLKVGLLFLWPSEYWASSFGFDSTVRDYVVLLRGLNVTTIVAVVNYEVLPAEKANLQRMGADVVLFPTARGAAAQRREGATYMLETHRDAEVVHTIHMEYTSTPNGFLLADAVGTANDTHNIPEDLKGSDEYKADVAFTQDLVDEVLANDRVLGVSSLEMPDGHVKEVHYDVCRHADCELGALATEAMLASRPGTELALLNGGALRAGWPAGEIRRSHVTAALPFQNFLCHLNMTAAGLLRAVEHGASAVTRDGDYNSSAGLTGHFLQTANFRYTFNPSLPAYSRVTSMEVRVEDGWAPIDFMRSYRVVTMKYLCEGGDGFEMRSDGQMDVAATADIWSIAIRYIQDSSPITPGLHGTVVQDFLNPMHIQLASGVENCTAEQVYLPEYEVCHTCPEDTERDDHLNVCVPASSSGSISTTVLAFVVCSAAFVFICGLLVLRQVEKKRRAHDTRFAPRGGDFVIVFTDIQQSSDLWSSHPKSMVSALAIHHRICRTLIERHEGYEVKTIGDSFMVAFCEPIRAARFMCQLQLDLMKAPWPAEMCDHAACADDELFSGLRVRVGAHVGPAKLTATQRGGFDYDGHTVNLAARVSDAGSGGQVVVSEPFYRAVEGSLDCLAGGVDVSFLGDFLFRGIPEQVGCYQLLPEELAHRDFPKLRNCRQAELATREYTNANTSAKKRLIEAMQYLRRWVGKYQSGLIPMQLADIMVGALEPSHGITPSVVISAILTTLAKGGGRPTPSESNGRNKADMADVGVKSGESSRDAASSYGGSQSAQSYSQGGAYRTDKDDVGLLRWSVMAEVLKALPPLYVLALEAYVRRTVHAMDELSNQPNTARRTSGFSNTDAVSLPGAVM